MAAEYVSEARISRIVATSRASVKIDTSYYTLEYQEERILPENGEFDIRAERQLLWDTVNAEVDNQIESLIETIKGN